MKSKYHEHFLRAAQKLDDVTKSNNAIYQLALDISNSFDPQAIKELCVKIQNISKTSNQELVIEVCKDLYLSLITVVGVERVQEITYKAQEDNDKAKERTLEELMTELNALIGLQKVKQKVTDLIAYKKVQSLRKQYNLKTASSTLHLAFIGNPGTGKTTVARILGNILFQKGVIKQKKFIEVSRSNLVGGYQGQTALKTHEVLESALGGVLFIDEAYTLYSGQNDDFGKEALDEVLKFMEDHRRDIVIIFAGYTREMHDFLQVNSGLQSRIPNVFDFEDYNPDEIVEIGLMGLRKQGYQVNEALYGEIVKGNYLRANDHSNGRWVRNLNEKLLRQVSTRVTREGSTDYNSILDQDLEDLRENGNSEHPHMVDDQGYVIP